MQINYILKTQRKKHDLRETVYRIKRNKEIKNICIFGFHLRLIISEFLYFAQLIKNSCRLIKATSILPYIADIRISLSSSQIAELSFTIEKIALMKRLLWQNATCLN